MIAYCQWSLIRNRSFVSRLEKCIRMSTTSSCSVSVIIPVHSASETIIETVRSAMIQTVPSHLESTCPNVLDVAVCCHDDGSTDTSWDLLTQLQQDHEQKEKSKDNDDDDDDDTKNKINKITTRLLISRNDDGIARGAGYARNRAVALRSSSDLICLLDSDDVMHETRVAEQVCAMLKLPTQTREVTIMGCTFARDPPESTWHYTQWANDLTDERLMLERFREVTVLQPTWCMTMSRFHMLGGYVEAPHPSTVTDDWSVRTDKEFRKQNNNSANDIFRVVHDTFDTPTSLRLAEDLRFFHSHLLAGGRLQLHRTAQPLVTYRHRAGQSQSSQTPRKLLLHLRALAFERAVLSENDSIWSGPFVIWGAGRDGKDFCKALSSNAQQRVACFVDVDEKKINAGYYDNKEMNIRIPIVHFSWLAKDCTGEADGKEVFGKIDKSRSEQEIELNESIKKRREPIGKETSPLPKKRKVLEGLDLSLLPTLPVVVCVAMYRTNGALEANVKSIGRTEGEDLWHFS